MTTVDSNNANLIPDTNHIVRYCSKRKWCPRNGKGIQPEAFISGIHPDKPISTNWLEFFGNDVLKSLECICRTMDYEGIKEDGRFLKINVGEIRKIKTESRQKVTVVYDGDRRNKNKSHTSIHPPEKDVFLALSVHAKKYGQLLGVPPNCPQLN